MVKEKVLWVNNKDQVLGEVERDEAHTRGLLHRETMMLMFADPERSRFWLQRRSPNKKQYPNRLTLSVTCHVTPQDVSGEDPEGYLGAGRREAPEELGVEAVKMELVGKILAELEDNLAIGGVVVAECVGEPKPDGVEVVGVNLYDKESVKEVVDELTPMAKMCLVYLGILAEPQAGE